MCINSYYIGGGTPFSSEGGGPHLVQKGLGTIQSRKGGGGGLRADTHSSLAQLIRLKQTIALPRRCHCHLTNHAVLWSPIGIHACHPFVQRNYIG